MKRGIWEAICSREKLTEKERKAIRESEPAKQEYLNQREKK